MISVDNFYYILYKNLLEPSRFSAAYFYPFGTTSANNLAFSWETDSKIHSEYLHSVLFYDQEPLLCKELPTQHFLALQNKVFFCNILANSEHSIQKKNLLKKENFYDWYYFYHGFAALCWFDDLKYLPKVEYSFSKVFINLNRLHTKYRSYRINLISEYYKRNLLDFGHISFASTNNEYGTWIDEISDPHTLLPKNKLKEIESNLFKISLPLVVDTYDPKGFASADSGPEALKLNQSALWHVVSETIFYQEKLHLTEKIFKPICSRRPFILVGAKGNLAYLRSYGFKTFGRWISEDYDNEEDNEKRLLMIVDEVEKLCKLSFHELKSMHKEMQDILEYNFNHFYNEFKKIIVDELVDNFQECLKIWNHDRFNEEKLGLDANSLRNIKNILLR